MENQSRIDADIQEQHCPSLLEVAQQVAHDLRSPLSALKMGIEELTELPQERRNLLLGALARINEIANNLLHKYGEQHQQEPSWFADCLFLKAKSRVVVVDDDSFAHLAWKLRLRELISTGGELVSFHRPADLMLWKNTQDSSLSNTLFLVDYEFANDPMNGLDLIQSLGIETQSILVTGRYSDLAIRSRCERLGVKIIPKPMISSVPIEIQT